MSRAPPQGGSRKISFNVSEQYDIQDVVGEGAYGVVCSAMHKPSGQKVAIKKITPFDHSMFWYVSSQPREASYCDFWDAMRTAIAQNATPLHCITR